MSVHGYTPSSSSIDNTTSPATSSSHQPSTKQLKVAEATGSEGSSAKVQDDSTDEDLKETAVPNVSAQCSESKEDDMHDADLFTPNANRQSTLEGGTPQVFVIGEKDEEKDEAVVDANKDNLNVAVKKEEGAGAVLTGRTPGGGEAEGGSSPNADPKPGGALSDTAPEQKTSTASSSELAGPQPLSSDNLLHSSTSARPVSLHPTSPRSLSDPVGLCTVFKKSTKP